LPDCNRYILAVISTVFNSIQQRMKPNKIIISSLLYLTDCHCAKAMEPIDLLFGLWTREGRRKHNFDRIRQVAPLGREGTLAPPEPSIIHLRQWCGLMFGHPLVSIIRSHRSTTYVDAAYCYRPSSVVCGTLLIGLAVGRSVSRCHTSD